MADKGKGTSKRQPKGTFPRRTDSVSFPFGLAGGTAQSYPFGAAQGYWPGMVAGFGSFGWIVTFLVLFFIGFVFWRVWGQVGPLLGGIGGLGGGFFW